MTHISSHIIIQKLKATVVGETGKVRGWVGYGCAFIAGLIGGACLF